MNNSKMYQVSTLQALALGYTKTVITVRELVKHGNIGLGTFEDVDGEMIVLDGKCYQAKADGTVNKAALDKGVPFCAVSHLEDAEGVELNNVSSINELKRFLDITIDENFSLNSMHMARIDGVFNKVMARSETGKQTRHVDLKTILEDNQTDFEFCDIRGTLVCVYFPDYMDGINAPGWHLHFVSESKDVGGHVFDIDIKNAKLVMNKISSIEIQLPSSAEFDTYALKEASASDIKKVEQGE